MGDVVSGPPQSQDHPLLRRRYPLSTSMVVVPTKLTLLPHHNSSSTTSTTTTSSSSSFPSDDLELLSIKPTSHSYTSLKDLLPSVAVNSSPSQIRLTRPSPVPTSASGTASSSRPPGHTSSPCPPLPVPPVATFSTVCGRASPPSLTSSATTLFGPLIGRSGLSGSGPPDSNGLACALGAYS
ncbi:hypothetical protein Pfo_004079 [Paulownia fortunei]|nr:hypothetical protein Pfo_004079 [Paulownia fortunei]